MSTSQSAEQVSAILAAKKVQIDPEVIAKRRAEKAAKKAQQRHDDAQEKKPDDVLDANAPPGFLKRTMIQLPRQTANNDSRASRSFTVMTWNMLAQALVRRTLFPGSDMLKWKDRGPVLTQEILHYDPDVACLQEVDKIEHHGPILEEAGYSYKYTTGYPTKLHGLCVIWKRDLMELVGEKIVKLDDATFDSAVKDSSSPRTGCSRATRNIGLFTALRFRGQKSPEGAQGLVLVTHHLFWHARHTYERARQIAILLRQIEEFRNNNGGQAWQSWPCIFAGDFNIQPSEAAYSLLTGAELTDDQKDALQLSTVVHSSLDKYLRDRAEAARTGDEVAEGDDKEDDDEGGAPAGEEYAQPEGDEDRVLKNTRPARESDGLLSLEQLQSAYQPFQRKLVSIYGQHAHTLGSQSGGFYGERDGAPDSLRSEGDMKVRIQRGYYEPAYTNITPLWRCTLDYLFLVPPLKPEASYRIEVTHLLPPHPLESLEPGLPRKEKEPSDHVALMAQLDIL